MGGTVTGDANRNRSRNRDRIRSLVAVLDPRPGSQFAVDREALQNSTLTIQNSKFHRHRITGEVAGIYSHPMSSGIFITFEGGEGTGKSSQMERLAQWFRDQGREVVVTREPGGTPIAEAVRALLLDPDLEPDGTTELFLLEAARHDHVERLIRPALERGAVVLADRFADSSTVYQGFVRGLGAAVVRQLNLMATGGLEPDLTLVFDLDPREALGRARGRNEAEGSTSRLDDEPLDFHLEIRQAFLRLAEAVPERIKLVDAGGGRDAVFERVLDQVRGWLR